MAKLSEIEAEYQAFVERCNRITDRDIEEAAFRRFIEAERRRRALKVEG